jgi:hypothetical protein
VRGEHLGRGPAAIRAAGLAEQALADQRLRQVRELGQVAGRAHRALAGDDWQQPLGEEVQKPRRQVRPDPGVPGGQRPGAQQQQRADHVVAERLAGARGVRPDDRALQDREVLDPDRRVRQRAEACVEPVHRRPAAERLRHHRAAGFHPGRCLRAEHRACLPARDRHDLLDGEGAAIDNHVSHAPQPATPPPVPPRGRLAVTVGSQYSAERMRGGGPGTASSPGGRHTPLRPAGAGRLFAQTGAGRLAGASARILAQGGR